ncbi:hypothetical protein Mp_8g13100 [Marchantia polymorpha subsp. ruderalis]|uniref:Uncharacterized protein n=1 Tax=Marchantia polymorpha TaxID=3197 RepID=A0A2R6WJL9_MARPO|nr:hypothetical protein MARPO_0083s0011 [Marchantia polymorpha]BBN19725.1 hypothetical protein Mp_8g13100 [Marchantia polymorpha subsp. ruderalis]|eukprot:PTQ34042.1 hypothetical protein MARPO_0083s0011 [Marchantia polymorpha]
MASFRECLGTLAKSMTIYLLKEALEDMGQMTGCVKTTAGRENMSIIHDGFSGMHILCYNLLFYPSCFKLRKANAN